MIETLAVLGSTGSVGTQTLEVAKHLGIRVTALTAAKNIGLLENQIREFKPKYAAVKDKQAAADLRIRVADTTTRVLDDDEGIIHAVTESDAAMVMNAIVGIAGLRPTLAALQAGKRLALSNKESLVAGGDIVMEASRRNHAEILPVDSEHSAVFQCLQACRSGAKAIRIILTASGGPFFGYTKQQMASITVEQALNHPNWDMGAKISVDSATMMNKGLEVIEAMHLFSMPLDCVDVVVHRESIVHSMIEFEDRSVLAQMGWPDMKIPIQYSLTHPNRLASPVERLSLPKLSNLTFFEPDYDTFDCLLACRRAAQRGGLYPAAVNGANEQAVQLFLKGKIRFLDIGQLVMRQLDRPYPLHASSVDEVFEADRMAREDVLAWAGKLN